MTLAPTYKYEVVGMPLVHDGDTVTVTVDLGFRLYHTLQVRMVGINAPELITAAGKAAKVALDAFVVAAGITGWTAVTYKDGKEKYGRWLATLYSPTGENVNQWMLDHGYAVAYLP